MRWHAAVEVSGLGFLSSYSTRGKKSGEGERHDGRHLRPYRTRATTVRAERGEYTARDRPSEGAVHDVPFGSGFTNAESSPAALRGVRAESLLRGPSAERPVGGCDAEVTPPELYAVLGQRSLLACRARKDKPGTLALAPGVG